MTTLIITDASDVWFQVDPDEAMTHDLTTTLRSELAALEYKRDRLMSEVNRLSVLPVFSLIARVINSTPRTV